MNAGLGHMHAMIAKVARWFRAEGGNIAPLIAIMAIPIVGAFGVAAETGSWWTLQRAQQNAADSAAIAAAIKGATSEGNTVATNYGYTDSVGNASVSWINTTAICPATVSNLIAGTKCMQVTITKKVPLYLTQVVGFRETGNFINGSTPAKTITASAIAGTIASTSAYCIGANDQVVMHGGGSSGANAFQGCSLIAGGSMTCSGTNAAGGVLYGASPSNGNNGGQNTCGTPTTDTSYADPYTTQIANAVSHTSACDTTQTGGGTINNATLQQGMVNCLKGGDWTLGTAWAATGANTIIHVDGGRLILGANLTTSGSGTMTVFFTGQVTTGTSILGFSGGNLDIASPNDGGYWDNVAVAVDPALTGGSFNGGGHFNACTTSINGTGCPQDITAAGNTTIDVTGLIYDTHGTITLSGAISKASSGSDICILLWAQNIVGNGGEAYGVPSPGRDCYNRNPSVPTINVVALLK